MGHKKKQRQVRPDEVLSGGPLSVARFGNNVVWQANWPKDAFAQMQRRAVEQFPDIVKEIDQLVSEIAQLVSELPSEELLHRAWWQMAEKYTTVKAESEIETDDAILIRMVDYIQSVIAAVAPAANQRREITEEEWRTLTGKVEELFRRVNGDYQICLSAKNKAEDPSFSDAFEEFRFKSQIYWCNVRGRRHQVHQPTYLRDMFLPHSGALQHLFNLTGEQFVETFSKIWHALTFGLHEAIRSFDQFRSDSLNALEVKMKGRPPPSAEELRKLMAEVVRERGWEQRRSEVFGRLLGTDLFDVQKTAALPQVLLDELTWSPGEEKEFFAEGDFRGWPLRIWPIFKRPFVRLNGRYYCFDLSSLFDNLYRVMQRIIFRLKPDYQETWKLVQQETSERLPIKYLQRILPGASVWQPVFYRWKAASGKPEWCEADGLFICDDHLLIIECRAGAFTYTSPATDFPSYVASLKNLVLKPATQGARFLDYLNSAETVAVFDKDHQQIGELRRSAFRCITICPVTLDPFTELAAQVQHLRKIGVDVGTHPVWAVSLDDLRVFADIFENPLIFLHFVEQRMRAFKSDVIRLEDEQDHLGLYLKHNHYTLHAEKMRGNTDTRVTFTGYRSEIDRFFYERMLDPATPCPLKQDMPCRLLEIIEFLSKASQQGRAQIASFLLDLDGDWRQRLAKFIDEELAQQPTTRRPQPLSTHGGVNLTMYCWTKSSMPRDTAQALNHTRAVLLVNGDDRRLLIELGYGTDGLLKDVSWQWVDKAGIPELQLPKLRADAEKLRKTRVSKVKAERRIGRNDPCPCGSGKKYKKCCLGR